MSSAPGPSTFILPHHLQLQLPNPPVAHPIVLDPYTAEIGLITASFTLPALNIHTPHLVVHESNGNLHQSFAADGGEGSAS